MKIFLDTADINEIHTAARWGLLDGVTTNPTLFAKVGGSYDDVLRQICQEHSTARRRRCERSLPLLEPPIACVPL